MGIDNNTLNSQSFKYKAALVGKTSNYSNPNIFVKNTKIIVPLKYLSNFWRSAGDSAKSKITDAKFNVPIVTLSTKDNVNLIKQLRDGFKRSVYWNNYQTIPAKVINKETNIYELLSTSFQGVKRLFVLAYDTTDNDEVGIKDNRKYFLPRAKI